MSKDENQDKGSGGVHPIMQGILDVICPPRKTLEIDFHGNLDGSETDPFEEYHERTGEKIEPTYNEGWEAGREAGILGGRERTWKEMLAMLDDITGKLDAHTVAYAAMYMRIEIRGNLRDIGRPLEEKT